MLIAIINFSLFFLFFRLLHYTLNFGGNFSLTLRQHIFYHSWNWSFYVSVRNICNSRWFFIDSLYNVSSYRNLTSNNFFVLRIGIVALFGSNIKFALSFTFFCSYVYKLSVCYWPGGFVLHVIDSEYIHTIFIRFFVQYLTFDTSRI